MRSWLILSEGWSCFGVMLSDKKMGEHVFIGDFEKTNFLYIDNDPIKELKRRSLSGNFWLFLILPPWDPG